MREIVEAADAAGLAVIGLEGLHFREGSLYPRLDLIADFSSALKGEWEEVLRRGNNGARKWLERLEPADDLVVTVVMVGECEVSHDEA